MYTTVNDVYPCTSFANEHSVDHTIKIILYIFIVLYWFAILAIMAYRKIRINTAIGFCVGLFKINLVIIANIIVIFWTMDNIF